MREERVEQPGRYLRGNKFPVSSHAFVVLSFMIDLSSALSWVFSSRRVQEAVFYKIYHSTGFQNPAIRPACTRAFQLREFKVPVCQINHGNCVPVSCLRVHLGVTGLHEASGWKWRVPGSSGLRTDCGKGRTGLAPERHGYTSPCFLLLKRGRNVPFPEYFAWWGFADGILLGLIWAEKSNGWP